MSNQLRQILVCKEKIKWVKCVIRLHCSLSIALCLDTLISFGHHNDLGCDGSGNLFTDEKIETRSD